MAMNLVKREMMRRDIERLIGRPVVVVETRPRERSQLVLPQPMEPYHAELPKRQPTEAELRARRIDRMEREMKIGPYWEPDL